MESFEVYSIPSFHRKLAFVSKNIGTLTTCTFHNSLVGFILVFDVIQFIQFAIQSNLVRMLFQRKNLQNKSKMLLKCIN